MSHLINQSLLWIYESLLQRRNTFAYYRDYQAANFITREQLMALRWNKLRELLLHCEQHVPYYRELWRNQGINVARDIVDEQAFANLPVLTKEIIRNHYPQLIAENLQQKNIAKTTGGSSGMPLRFELDAESDQRRRAVMWRGYAWCGYPLGAKTLYLWGADAGPKSLKHRLKDALYHRLHNRLILNSFAMSRDNLDDYIAQWNRYQPEVVVGYVTPLVYLAEWVLEKGCAIHRPSVVLTGAEALYPHQREVLSRAFGAAVANTYGCREVMLMGAEHQRCGVMHASDDHLYLETVDAASAVIMEQPGDLLITDLHNYGFPLIRYKNNDRLTLSDGVCSCGLPHRIIRAIHGRELEHIKTLSGNVLPGEFFPHLLKDVRGLVKFQVIQKTAADVELHFVKSADFDENRWRWSVDIIRQQIGEGMQVHEIVRDDIPLTVSGKHLVCVNEWLKTTASSLTP